MHPGQRCTVASVAGHAMYERSNPYFEHVAGGTLDMSECRYEQVAEKTTRISGAAFRPAAEFRVKLEGAGRIGERFGWSVVRVRDARKVEVRVGVGVGVDVVASAPRRGHAGGR